MSDARWKHWLPRWIATHRGAAWWWAWFFVVWLLLVPKWSWGEVTVGVFAAALCAALQLGTGVSELFIFRPRLGGLASVAATVAGLPPDFAKLAWALGRQLLGREPARSRYRRMTIPADGDDPRRRTWRALKIAGHSLLPNSYVIGIDEETNTMLLHELVSSDPPEKPES